MLLGSVSGVQNHLNFVRGLSLTQACWSVGTSRGTEFIPLQGEEGALLCHGDSGFSEGDWQTGFGVALFGF